MSLSPSASEYGLPERPECPFCGAHETALFSPFGPQLSVATYWCDRCHTAFEWMKWKPVERPAANASNNP